ncbi:MAG: transcriptional repressor [Candidatus Tectomicrobia bacterium]|uniref:Ferric uptake regulation protein n=1 Tax=Tectimicrobiota bacterium TaxID=2528274 RepID=A0A933LR68_UNCTE|nr:transcriptional repressor [Candidatus Tectomicrobia bacterium]
MNVEKDVLKDYLYANGLKYTKQRQIILNAFLGVEDHISADELFKLVIKLEPSIGLATIYRTLALLCHCGLAQERQFGDNQTRYEHVYNHVHHDHLICTSCGKITEFSSPKIEKLQKGISTRHKFKVLSHKLELYGLCSLCQKGQHSSE